MLRICLIWLVSSFFAESSGQIVITQTPPSLQASPGDRVTIQCKAASSVSIYMALYQFKSGQKPKLLIYEGSTRFEGTPDRFSGSRSGNDFSFTINGVHAEDEGVYYCGQSYSFPLHSDTLQYKNQLSGLRQKEGRNDCGCLAATAAFCGRTSFSRSDCSRLHPWHYQQQQKRGTPGKYPFEPCQTWITLTESDMDESSTSLLT
ncbi:light chain kappa variable region [Podarcis lilfordi]|uniref:Light chain kappa variable region n=1 Tax=Podarcis lilfordi TaxID=74358 RepID=A0AA35PM56_9SAUR|nr:light chain kappa variable region [Podarcis lilfordi]